MLYINILALFSSLFCGADGIGFAGPFHPEVTWASNAKPLLLHSKWFLFSFTLMKTSFQRVSEKQKTR
jgi:hypothetical protein